MSEVGARGMVPPALLAIEEALARLHELDESEDHEHDQSKDDLSCHCSPHSLDRTSRARQRELELGVA